MPDLPDEAAEILPLKAGEPLAPPEVLRKLELIVRREQVESRLPSLSVAVARDGRMWQLGVGHLDARPGGPVPTPTTQYRMGSISKTFVAVLVLRLRDEGLLDLDDTLQQHLPGTAIGQVRIAELLSHTSGLAAETLGQWWERTPGGSFDDLLPSLRLVHRPGSRFHYSNVGFAVLGELVARLRGRPYGEILDDELLRPLGLDDTTALPRIPFARGLGVHPRAEAVQAEPSFDARAMAPAGQLWSVPTDLLRWGEVLRGGAEGVIAADTVAEMRRPRGVHDEPGEPWDSAHGLGLEVTNEGGRRFVGHGGSMPGFLAGLVVDVAEGSAAAAMCNATSGGRMSALALRLLSTLACEAPQPPPAWTADAGTLAHLDLNGEWFWGTTSHLVHVSSASELELRVPGPGRPDRFIKVGDGEWLGLDGYFAGESLRVVRRGTAAAYLDIASFRFSRTPYDPAADVPGGTVPWR